MTKNIKIGLLMLAAVFTAMLLTGCSGNDFVEEIELEEKPIEFTSTTKNATRAAVANTDDLATAGGFYVWGWKTPTQATLDWANSYNIFNKVNVYSNATSHDYIAGAETTWTYAVKKYWDSKSTYCFYAAGPVNNPAGTITLVDGSDNSDKHFEITGVTSMSSADDSKYNDFIIDRTEKGTGVKNQKQAPNVDFTFHHVMSKVALKFKAGIDNCTIKVTDVKLTGWSNATYNFTQNLNYTGDPNLSEWTAPNNDTNQAGEATFDVTTVPVKVKGLNNEATVPNYWIMVPQAVANLKFTVSYTITYSDGVKDTFENVEATLTNQNWYTDCCTTYTLTISPQPIKFDVNSVSWTGNSDATIIVQ